MSTIWTEQDQEEMWKEDMIDHFYEYQSYGMAEKREKQMKELYLNYYLVPSALNWIHTQLPKPNDAISYHRYIKECNHRIHNSLTIRDDTGFYGSFMKKVQENDPWTTKILVPQTAEETRACNLIDLVFSRHFPTENVDLSLNNNNNTDASEGPSSDDSSTDNDADVGTSYSQGEYVEEDYMELIKSLYT